MMKSTYKMTLATIISLIGCGLVGCGKTIHLRAVDGATGQPLSDVHAQLQTEIANEVIGTHEYERKLNVSTSDGIINAKSLNTDVVNDIILSRDGYSDARVRVNVGAQQATVDTPVDLTHERNHAPTAIGRHAAPIEVNGTVTVPLYQIPK